LGVKSTAAAGIAAMGRVGQLPLIPRRQQADTDDDVTSGLDVDTMQTIYEALAVALQARLHGTTSDSSQMVIQQTSDSSESLSHHNNTTGTTSDSDEPISCHNTTHDTISIVESSSDSFEDAATANDHGQNTPQPTDDTDHGQNTPQPTADLGIYTDVTLSNKSSHHGSSSTWSVISNTD
jgi:hypothetical protein